jgi:hypothetical protein
MGNSAFFYLYAWSDFDEKILKVVELGYCIKLLANKILNSVFAPYYYGYFLEPFQSKYFNTFNYINQMPGYYSFNTILNEALIIAYQLNYVICVYDLYYKKKTITFSNRPKNELIHLNYQNLLTNEYKVGDGIAPFYDKNNIETEYLYSLGINISCYEYSLFSKM